MKLFRLTSILFLSIWLVACGGSSETLDPDNPSGSTPSSPSASEAGDTLSQDGSITFESVSPGAIVLKGAGGTGQKETAELIFVVTDANGDPIQNQLVSFAFESLLPITTDQLNPTLGKTQAYTDEDGKVSAIVSSGDLAQVVKVQASTVLANGTTSTTSDALVISTGVTAKRNFKIVSKNKVVDNNLSGTVNKITAFLSDDNNNFVADGTIVYFSVNDYGLIDDSCQTENGSCSVDWVTNENVPSGNELVTVTAFTKGKDYSEESPTIENITDTTSFSATTGEPTVTLQDLGGTISILLTSNNYAADATCPNGYNVPTGSTIAVSTLGGSVSTASTLGNTVKNHICAPTYGVDYTGSSSTVSIFVTLPSGNVGSGSVAIP